MLIGAIGPNLLLWYKNLSLWGQVEIQECPDYPTSPLGNAQGVPVIAQGAPVIEAHELRRLEMPDQKLSAEPHSCLAFTALSYILQFDNMAPMCTSGRKV